MEKIDVYVCENFFLEYKEAVEIGSIDDVEIHQFNTLCDHKKYKEKLIKGYQEKNNKDRTMIFSKSCDMMKIMIDVIDVKIMATDFCFSNLICNEYIRSLIASRSYIITVSWLRKWEEHIENMGFDKDTARMFFHESAKNIALLDGLNDDNDKLLIEKFASYVDLPYKIIHISLNNIIMILNNMVNSKKIEYLEKSNNNFKNKVAEYAVIFDIFSRISTYTKKREIIEKIKELFLMVFGAKDFIYWSEDSEVLPDKVVELIDNKEVYYLSQDNNRLCVKIINGDDYFGTIDVKGFIFPEYINQYLNLAIEISRLSGLILKNNLQYEKILKSEQELKYFSFHDIMTGLYNRTYINRIIENEIYDNELCVFMFDIDGLKKVNDNFGHAEGDNLIISFAEILKMNFRDTDIVARIGGDEFMAILYNTDENFDEKVKNRLVNLIELNNQNIKEKHLELSASIGYARANSEYKTIEDLMKVADYIMYDNKMKKKNKKCIPCDN